MEQEFYRERLAAHGLKIIVPPEEARDFIHAVIYDELALGDIRETSRSRVLEIIEELAKAGAAGMVLANTELPLLIRVEDTRAIEAISVALTAQTV